MTTNNPGKRPAKLAVALGAILLTAGCATSYDPMYAGLPQNLDGGVGQLLRYCSKFQNSGDLVTAAGLCERAHRLEPANPAPLMQLAEILQGLDQPEQAMAAYQTIIEAAPRYTDARYELGKMHIARGEYDLAAAQFQTALHHRTDDPRLYNALGIAHGLVGANQSALEAFEAGLKVAPHHISLRNNMGLALVMNGRHEEGVKMLEAVAADPAADETSYKNLQLAYGMVSAAKADQAASDMEQSPGEPAQESMTPVEPAPVEPVIQMAAAPSPAHDPAAQSSAPLPLVPDAETERAYNTSGETETPIEVTVMEDSAAQADRSPLRMQTAKAASGDIADSNAPSASMGEYLTADASYAGAPAATATPSTPQTEVAALQPMAPNASDAAMGGDYAVQLASYRSEGRAMEGWTELRASAPDLLGAITPMIRQAELGEDQGTVYRLRTAPAAKDEAAALCTELKARGMDCLVVKDAPAETGSGSQAG